MRQSIILFLVPTVITLVLLIAALVEGWDFSFVYVLCVIVVSAPAALLFWILSRLKLVKPEIYKLALTLFTISILSLIIAEPLRILQKDLSIEEGDRIVTALEHYYSDHQKYPKDLSQLLPDYLNEIPHPKTGVFTTNNFRFYPEYHSYSLSFRYVSIDIGGAYIYRSGKEYSYWAYDD